MRPVVLVVMLALPAPRAARAQAPEPVVVEPAAPEPTIIEPPATGPARTERARDHLRVVVYAGAGVGSGRRNYDTLPQQNGCDPKRPHVEYESRRLGVGLGVRWSLSEHMEAQIRGTLSTFPLGEAFKELCNPNEPPYLVDLSALQPELEGTMRLRVEDTSIYLGVGPRIGYVIGSGRAVSERRDIDAGFSQPVAGVTTEAGYLLGAKDDFDLTVRFGFLWAGEVTQLDLGIAVGYAVW